MREPDQARNFGYRVLHAPQKRLSLQDTLARVTVPGGDFIFLVKDTQQVNFAYANRPGVFPLLKPVNVILAVMIGGVETWNDVVAKIVRELGRIDIFVSNAGTIRRVPAGHRIPGPVRICISGRRLCHAGWRSVDALI